MDKQIEVLYGECAGPKNQVLCGDPDLPEGWGNFYFIFRAEEASPSPLQSIRYMAYGRYSRRYSVGAAAMWLFTVSTAETSYY